MLSLDVDLAICHGEIFLSLLLSHGEEGTMALAFGVR
jgi:hypothetical protein